MLQSGEMFYQKELLNMLVENMPIGIFAKDPEQGFKYVLANKAFCTLREKNLEDILDKTDYDFFKEEEALLVRSEDLAVMKERKIIDLGLRTFSLADGTIKIHDTIKFPIFNKNGTIKMVVGIVTDVTERENLQHQLRQSQKMEAVGRLAGGIAHEFNNILQIVLGYGELLKVELSDDPRRERVDTIVEAGTKASALVRQLLSFGRKESGSKVRLDINDVVTKMKKMLGDIIGEHIEIILEKEANLPEIFANLEQVEQMLLNLMMNAVDALKKGGKLIIRTRSRWISEEDLSPGTDILPGGYVLIEIEDTGIGIRKEDLKSIFDPFFSRKEEGKGSGLGLATVYGIVKSHKGSIEVESTPEVGSIFKVILPAATMSDAWCHPGQGIDSSISETESEQNIIVLVAEDNKRIRELSGEILKKAGYEAFLTSNGKEALETFRANSKRINLLLLDVIMPEMNGQELYEEIQKIKPEIPVVFCTGFSRDLLQSDYMLKINGRILYKPYNSEELLNVLREVSENM